MARTWAAGGSCKEVEMNANVQVAAHSEVSAPPAGGEFDYLLDRITAAEAYADPFEH